MVTLVRRATIGSMAARRSSTTMPAHFTRIALLGALLPISGCLSKPITKEEAAALISESPAFKREKSVRLPRQITFKRGWGSRYGQERPLSVSELAHVDPTVAILKLHRAVRVEESIYGPGGGALHLFVITPIDLDPGSLLPDTVSTRPDDPQGLADWRAERSQTRSIYGISDVKREREWRIPVGTRELVQVDQIHNWKDPNIEIPVNELAVDFSWRWLPNDMGDAFDTRSSTFESFPDSVQEAARIAGVRMNTGELMRSRAFFKRESDGKWKVRLIEWSFGRGNPD